MKKIFGPYITELESKGNARYKDVDAVIDSKDAIDAVRGVASSYVEAGCDVATTNTFGLRKLVKAGDYRRVQTALNIQHAIVRSAIDEVVKFGRPDLFIALGPYATDSCYDHEAAPDVADSLIFHSTQLDFLKKLGGDFDAALFETISTVREAVGIAYALESREIPGYVSFVVDAEGDLLSGESVENAIREVRKVAPKWVEGFGLNCCPIEGGEKALESLNRKKAREVKIFYPNASSADPREHHDGDACDKVDRSHQILNRADDLYEIASEHPGLEVIGGCCGHDHEDLGRIVEKFRSRR